MRGPFNRIHVWLGWLIGVPLPFGALAPVATLLGLTLLSLAKPRRRKSAST